MSPLTWTITYLPIDTQSGNLLSVTNPGAGKPSLVDKSSHSYPELRAIDGVFELEGEAPCHSWYLLLNLTVLRDEDGICFRQRSGFV